MSLSVLIVFIVTALLALPIIVFLYLIFTGIIGIILTNEAVSVYLGTEKNTNINLNLGRFKLKLSSNIFDWIEGKYLLHQKIISFERQMICAISGLSLTLILTSFALFYGLNLSVNIYVRTVSITLFVAAIYFLINTIFSDREPKIGRIQHFNPDPIFNLKMLNAHRKIPDPFFEAYSLELLDKSEKASHIYEKLIENNSNNELLLRYSIANVLRIGDKIKAEKYLIMLCENNTFVKANDYCKLGLLQALREDFEASIQSFNAAYKLNAYDVNVLISRGFTYIILEEYQKSINDFNKAINIDEKNAYAYANRGLAKIKQGNKEAGLIDIEKGKQINQKEPYIYRSLGIHHMDEKRYDKAIIEIKKAVALFEDVYKGKELIEELSKLKKR